MPEDARPDLQFLNLDPALFVREDIRQLERHRIFARTWQFMGPDAALPARTRSVEGTLAVVREDYQVCVETHRNYASGACTPGPLSGRHERGVQYFQTCVTQALGV